MGNNSPRGLVRGGWGGPACPRSTPPRGPARAPACPARQRRPALISCGRVGGGGGGRCAVPQRLRRRAGLHEEPGDKTAGGQGGLGGGWPKCSTAWRAGGGGGVGGAVGLGPPSPRSEPTPCHGRGKVHTTIHCARVAHAAVKRGDGGGVGVEGEKLQWPAGAAGGGERSERGSKFHPPRLHPPLSTSIVRRRQAARPQGRAETRGDAGTLLTIHEGHPLVRGAPRVGG